MDTCGGNVLMDTCGGNVLMDTCGGNVLFDLSKLDTFITLHISLIEKKLTNLLHQTDYGRRVARKCWL